MPGATMSDNLTMLIDRALRLALREKRNFLAYLMGMAKIEAGTTEAPEENIKPEKESMH
ncbi:MAG TPA: hypothetical protein VLQ68_02390 [Rhizobiaceae bacterium]|nr:hypothetical protein [Rhizobiaceae bacterium]